MYIYIYTYAFILVPCTSNAMCRGMMKYSTCVNGDCTCIAKGKVYTHTKNGLTYCSER